MIPLFAVYVRIDDTLPWIETKGSYSTRKEANMAVKDLLKSVQVKIVSLPEERRQIGAVAQIKTRH